jgi:chromosome segregation ATPase
MASSRLVAIIAKHKKVMTMAKRYDAQIYRNGPIESVVLAAAHDALAASIDALTSDKARLQMRIGELEAELTDASHELVTSVSALATALTRAKAIEADRDQISLTLDVAKADRDKWFNKAKALEAELADAKLEGSRHANRVLKAQVGARDARIAAAENLLACTRDGVSDWLREQISVFLGSAPERSGDANG